MGNFIDLAGKRFGKLVAESRGDDSTLKSGRKIVMWKCKCDCGNYASVSSANLIHKRAKSCGCLRYKNTIKLEDLTGMKFGKLLVIKESDYFYGKKKRCWKCQCDCGEIRYVLTAALNNGAVTKCKSCCRKQQSENAIRMSKSKPGYTKTHLYISWCGMKQRCSCRKTNGYENYGGRGITVCAEWKNSFENFRDWSFQNGYKEGLSLDRIDVNGNYEPSNCRWATMKEQANNKRNSHILEFDGQKHTISEWSEITGINKNTIHSRIEKYGWSVERSLTVKPINGGKYGDFDK